MPSIVVRPALLPRPGNFRFETLYDVVPCVSNTIYEGTPATVDTGLNLTRFLNPGIDATGERQSFVHFDEAVEGGGSLIALAMQAAPRWKNDGTSPGSFPASVAAELWLLDTDWNPAALTWNTRPSFSGVKARLDAEIDTLDTNADLLCLQSLILPVPAGTWYGAACRVVADPEPSGAVDFAQVYFGSGLTFKALARA